MYSTCPRYLVINVELRLLFSQMSPVKKHGEISPDASLAKLQGVVLTRYLHALYHSYNDVVYAVDTARCAV